MRLARKAVRSKCGASVVPCKDNATRRRSLPVDIGGSELRGRHGPSERCRRSRHCGEQQLPPLGVATQKNGVRKTMAGGMVLRNGVPANVLDRHPCLFADRIEPYLNLRDLIGCEAGLPPCEGE